MHKAKALIGQQKFAAALEIIDAELKKSPNNEKALLLRSTLYTREAKPELALKDAEKAVVLTKGSQESQLRRAICLWRLKRIGEAKGLVKYFGKNQEADTWKQLIEQAEGTASETPEIPQQENSTSNAAPAPASAPAPVPRFDWYQSSGNANVVLYRKGLVPEETKIEIEPLKLTVTSGSFNWSLDLGNEIDPAASSFDLTAFKVEFVLSKKDNISWSSLESKDSLAPANSASAATTKPPSSSASKSSTASTVTSYSKWDNLDDDDEGGNSVENEGDPMAFFQRIYKDAPPETQRAMMKSYIESNGTALSTNWDEVSKGKVETHPPSDMEAKKW